MTVRARAVWVEGILESFCAFCIKDFAEHKDDCYVNRDIYQNIIECFYKAIEPWSLTLVSIGTSYYLADVLFDLFLKLRMVISFANQLIFLFVP